MTWTKSPQGLIDLFDASLPQAPGLARRQMFGYPAAFVNGNMFAGLFQDVAFARLPPGARSELDGEFGARHFEPLPGRPMRAYVVLPDEVLEDETRYAALLATACAFTRRPSTQGEEASQGERLIHHIAQRPVNALRRSLVGMDPITTARYGLMAASRRFEASATHIAGMRADENVDLGHEVVEMVQAKHAFSANISVIRFAQDMWDSLLQLQSR